MDASTLYSFEETVRLGGVTEDLLVLYIKLGFVVPVEETAPHPPTDPRAMRFDDDALYVMRRVTELRHEHGVNLKGIGLVLSLVRQIQRLEAELRFLRGQ